jgi:hypothetical protein
VICLIAQFVALPDQESNHEGGASKQLAPQSVHTFADRKKAADLASAAFCCRFSVSMLVLPNTLSTETSGIAHAEVSAL